MAQSRYYSATAQPTVLTGSITNATTVINVAATTGFPPTVPFILALDYNTPSEEIVLATLVAGTAITVTRGYDSTSATSHNVGAGVRHTWTAMDGNDSRGHEGSSQNVHGIGATSSVVGTTDSQTLTNKTLTNPTINAATVTGNVAGNPTFTAGAAIGSTGQFTVDASGNLTAAGNINTGAWTSFTPAWTSTGTTPTLGNGTLESKYCRIGRVIHWKGRLVMGSTTTGGTGLWFMSLPVAQSNTSNFTELGSMNYIAGGNNYVGEVSINPTDGNKATFIVKTTTSNVSFDNVTGTAPVSVANGNVMLWAVTYEAAS